LFRMNKSKNNLPFYFGLIKGKKRSNYTENSRKSSARSYAKSANSKGNLNMKCDI
jgi:hypothetical protein